MLSVAVVITGVVLRISDTFKASSLAPPRCPPARLMANHIQISV